MANVQLYRITFLQDQSPFATGDVLDIYVDTDLAVSSPVNFLGDTDGISVQLNGVDYPSSGSGFILYVDSTKLSVQSFNPLICIGTSLLQIDSVRGLWPYASYVPKEDHYSCVVNPPTCDLIVVGIPTVIPATTSVSTDGSITVTASSTNPIQYRLGSDFTYGDGSGQSSGVFNGLLAGSYRIYLRDSANCLVSVLVNVPINNNYGTKYRLEYTDNQSILTRIDVKKRGYDGSVIEVCGQPVPFEVSLRGEGEIDKFTALLGTTVNLNLTSETDQQFLELYTNDPNLFRIDYFKTHALDLKGIYRVLPQQYVEEHKAAPYYVSVTGIDGLADLQNYFLIQDDGQKYFGTIKLIKLVAHCLRVLNLELPIRVACNLYADTMDQTDSDDPFDQAYIDFEAIYLSEKEPKLDYVLKSILEPFGARITQWEGRWNIVRVEEMTESYDYRDFDKDGEYTGNGSYDPVIELDTPANNGDLLLVNKDHNLELRPGYGSIRGIYHLGLKPNILNNGDFRLRSVYIPSYNLYTYFINKDGWTLVNAGYTLNESYELIDNNNVAYVISSGDDTLSVETGGEAYIQSDTYSIRMGSNNQIKISIRCKVNRNTVSFGASVYTIDVPYVKVRIRVKYGSLYLQSNGTWSTTENKVTFFITEFAKFTEFEIVANQPTSGSPTTGMDFDVRVYHAYAFHAQYLDKADLEAAVTFASGSAVIPNGYKTELRTGGKMYYYELEETDEATSGFTVVEPDDYNAGTNPRKYILKHKRDSVGGIAGTNVYPFTIDKVQANFLTDGKDPLDAIIRTSPAEVNNKEIFEKEIIFGSYSTLILSEQAFGIDISAFFPHQSGLTLSSTNILAAETIYTGYLRDSNGVGYEYFARDGVSESDKLHGILLKSYTLQYRRSWRLLRGSIYTQEYFGLLNTVRDASDNDRIYLPMGITYNDKMCTWSGEFLELMSINDTPGSDGGGSSPFNSAFSIGFGQSGFN